MAMSVPRLLFAAGLLLPLTAVAAGFETRPSRVDDPALRRLAADLERNGTLATLATELDAMFALPAPVGLRLVQCDEPNAYYDPEQHEVELCLELFDDMAATLRPQFDTEADVQEALSGAFVATALHEVGHALIDVYQLPVTGREEDAADQFAAWLLLNAGQDTAVLGVAATYWSEQQRADQDLADEHSLDQQRYFNHVCWVYGSDPDGHAFLLDDEWALPDTRAEQCQAEYQLLERSWNRLLDGHRRAGAIALDGAPALPAAPAADVADSSPRRGSDGARDGRVDAYIGARASGDARGSSTVTARLHERGD